MSPLGYGLGCVVRDGIKKQACDELCREPCRVIPSSCSTGVHTLLGPKGFRCSFACDKPKDEYRGGPIIVE